MLYRLLKKTYTCTRDNLDGRLVDERVIWEGDYESPPQSFGFPLPEEADSGWTGYSYRLQSSSDGKNWSSGQVIKANCNTEEEWVDDDGEWIDDHKW